MESTDNEAYRSPAATTYSLLGLSCSQTRPAAAVAAAATPNACFALKRCSSSGQPTSPCSLNIASPSLTVFNLKPAAYSRTRSNLDASNQTEHTSLSAGARHLADLFLASILERTCARTRGWRATSSQRKSSRAERRRPYRLAADTTVTTTTVVKATADATRTKSRVLADGKLPVTCTEANRVYNRRALSASVRTPDYTVSSDPAIAAAVASAAMAPSFRVTEGSANVLLEPRVTEAKSRASGMLSASRKPATAVAASSASGSCRLEASGVDAAVSSTLVDEAFQEASGTAIVNDACLALTDARVSAYDEASRVVPLADVAVELDGDEHSNEHARCSPVLRRKPMDVPSKKVRQLFALGEEDAESEGDEEEGVKDTWSECLEPESRFSDMNVIMASGTDVRTSDSLPEDQVRLRDQMNDVSVQRGGDDEKDGNAEAVGEFVEEIELEFEEEEVEEEEQEEVEVKGEEKEKAEESDSDEDDDDEDDDEEEEDDEDEEDEDEGEEEEMEEEEEEREQDGYQIVLKVGQVMLPCKVKYDNEEIVQIVEAVDDSEFVEVVDDVSDTDDVSLDDVDSRGGFHDDGPSSVPLPESNENPPRVLSLCMDDSSPLFPSSPTSGTPCPSISLSPPPTESLEQEHALPAIPTATFKPAPRSILKRSFVERGSKANAGMSDMSRKRQREGSQRGSADEGRKGVEAEVCAELRGVRPTARERVQSQMAAAEAAVKLLVERSKGGSASNASSVDGAATCPPTSASSSLAADVLHQMELLQQAVTDVTKPRKRLRFADELGKELNHVRVFHSRR